MEIPKYNKDLGLVVGAHRGGQDGLQFQLDAIAYKGGR